MEARPETLKKVNSYRNLLFFINLPLIAIIPFALESGLVFDVVHSEKADSLYMVLQSAEFFIFFNSIFIYQTIKRMITRICYLPETDKLEITQLKTLGLKEKKFVIDPKDIVKCKRLTLNPMVGYRSVINSNDRYLSEGTSTWYDR